MNISSRESSAYIYCVFLYEILPKSKLHKDQPMESNVHQQQQHDNVLKIQRDNHVCIITSYVDEITIIHKMVNSISDNTDIHK